MGPNNDDIRSEAEPFKEEKAEALEEEDASELLEEEADPFEISPPIIFPRLEEKGENFGVDLSYGFPCTFLLLSK